MPLSRPAALRRLASEPFDLLVVGGGITGCGIARDAAMRGLRVALVERHDWASGTSSRSSRLVHGGVRYLEHGALGLVFEASRERRTLLRIAPHLVRPLPFTWPVYAHARVPLWKLRLGLAAYDALALFRNVAAHEGLSPAEVLALEPALDPAALAGGARYWDAATDDARLTLANALAACEAGAAAVNYVALAGLAPARSGAGYRVALHDMLGGATLDAHAIAVVNAAGPWADEVRGLTGDGARGAGAVRGTKGVHVAVPRARLGNRAALTLLSPVDGRVMFALPAGPHAIVGTTDTRTPAHPGEVRAAESDVDYLLRSANAFFPAAALTRDDVVSAWAGIRPLAAAAHPRGEGGSTAAASREHTVTREASGLITVTGGKLTTYRAMAAEVVTLVERTLGRTAAPAPTQLVPLPGGDAPDRDAVRAAAAARVPHEAAAARLAAAHGSRWATVWAPAERDAALAAPIVAGLPYLLAEVMYAATHEGAQTLADVLVRRVPVAFETRDAGRAAARTAAPVLAACLGWSAGETERELARYDAEAARLFGVDAA
jgi:glycerol-3-phosphate dehydrogenase